MTALESAWSVLERLDGESERACLSDSDGREIEAQGRAAALREACLMVETWALDPQDTREDLLARVRERALVATERQRAERGDPEREGRRRGWWRATFLLAEAFGTAVFESRSEAPGGQSVIGEQPQVEGDQGDVTYCAGLRKDGQPCGGLPIHGSDFCHHHQGQQVAMATDPSGELDRRVEVWLAEFDRTHPARKGLGSHVSDQEPTGVH